MILICKF